MMEYKIQDSTPVNQLIVKDESFDLSSATLFIGEVKDHEILSRDEEKKLFNELDRCWPDRRTSGKDSPVPEAAQPIFAKIASHYYKLVLSVAKDFTGRDVSMSDLIQDCNFALLIGLRKFDQKRDVKCSTYVTWWLRQAAGRSLAQNSRTIRNPVHLHDFAYKMSAIRNRLSAASGEDVSIDDLANETGENPEKIKLALDSIRSLLSMDAEGGDEGDSVSFGDMLAADVCVEDEAEQGVVKELINDVLNELPCREAKIIRLRFGLVDGNTYTLEQVGQMYGLTRERIRQIESGTLRKLRHPMRSRRLRGLAGVA